MGKKGRFLSQGNTAEIYEWEADKILKLYRQGLPKALCENEFRVTKSVYDLLQIAPKPFEIIQVGDRVGAVFKRIQGRTMLKEILSKPWTFRKYSRLLAQYHISIQKPVEFELPTVKDKLKWDIESSTLLSNEEKQQIYQYISTLPDGNKLCHFDFHPGNIMVSNGQYRVIDWMTGCKGDGLSDIARTSIILRYSGIPRVPRFINLIFKKVINKIYRGYLNEYLKTTGVPVEKIRAWEMPVAAARLCEWIPEDEKQTLLTFVRKSISCIPPSFPV